jgi:hypothetical protein
LADDCCFAQEYIEIMGGLDSPGFARFKQLFKEGFEAARKHSDSILSKWDCDTGRCVELIPMVLRSAIVELMQKGKTLRPLHYLHH